MLVCVSSVCSSSSVADLRGLWNAVSLNVFVSGYSQSQDVCVRVFLDNFKRRWKSVQKLVFPIHLCNEDRT